MEWFAMSSKFYADLDDEGVSEAAQTLLMRVCAYIAEKETSGYIAKPALKKLGLSRLSRRLDELIAVRTMVETADGLGYDLPAWMKWNGPLERQVNKRKADRERIAEKRAIEENVARQSGVASRDVASLHNNTTDTPNGVSTPDSASPADVKPKKVAKLEPRDPAREELCRLLLDRVRENGYEADGARNGETPESWRKACRLMVERDGRTVGQIDAAIRWSQDHDFWQANIRSMTKLRAQYATMQAQAARDAKRPAASATAAGTARQAQRDAVDDIVARFERIDSDGLAYDSLITDDLAEVVPLRALEGPAA